MINVDELIKDAIKSKDEYRIKVYRALKANILKYKTSKDAKPYDEDAELQLLKKMKSQYEESIAQFTFNNREDLADQESKELQIIEEHLPKETPLNEIEGYLIEFMMANDLCTKEDGIELFEIPKKQMGTIIKELKAKFPMNDGKDISNIVKNYVV